MREGRYRPLRGRWGTVRVVFYSDMYGGLRFIEFVQDKAGDPSRRPQSRPLCAVDDWRDWDAVNF